MADEEKKEIEVDEDGYPVDLQDQISAALRDDEDDEDDFIIKGEEDDEDEGGEEEEYEDDEQDESEDDEEEAQDSDDSQVEKEEVEPLLPPQHFSPADKERFRKADREWQEWIVQRDKGATNHIREMVEEVKPLYDAAKPWINYAEQFYKGPISEVVDNLFKVDRWSRENIINPNLSSDEKFVNTVHLVNQLFGFNIVEHLEQVNKSRGEDGTIDPNAARIAELERRDKQRERQIKEERNNAVQQQNRAQQEDLTRWWQNIVTEARNSTYTDENGEIHPSFPFLDEVLDDMDDLYYLDFQKGRFSKDITVFEKHYETAAYRNPNTRAGHLEDLTRLDQRSQASQKNQQKHSSKSQNQRRTSSNKNKVVAPNGSRVNKKKKASQSLSGGSNARKKIKKNITTQEAFQMAKEIHNVTDESELD